MKRWFFAQLLMIAVVLIYGQVCKHNFLDYGFYNLDSYQDIKSFDCSISKYYGYTEENETDIYNNFKQYKEDYIQEYSKGFVDTVIIAKPLGRLKQCKESFGQEVLVKKVIQGSEIEQGETYFVYSFSGFGFNEEGEAVYSGVRTVMNPDSEYLMFLTESELNQVQREKQFYIQSGDFRYLNLSRNDSVPIDNKGKEVLYSEYADSEFLASSQPILDELYEIKKEIVEMYIN